MFEKLKRIYEKIINFIRHNRKIKRLDTLNYEKVIELMRKKGAFQEFESELNNFDEIEELMRNKTNLHGINHVVRVLFNSYAVTTLENVNDEDRKIVIEAAKLHDIGRVSDGEDEEHGNQSAIKARKILEEKGFSAEQIDLICFIIKEHSLPKSKNEKHIEELPEELRQRYKYCLNLLKDADKLDRVRLGDLDSKRLSTDSAKRLVGVSKDVFENNRHYYKKKMKVYPFNEEEAQKLLEQIKEVNPELDIDLDEIKKNYSKYKAIQEQGKIEWFKRKNTDIPLSDFIDIISVLSKEDTEYIGKKFLVGPKIVIEAIHAMGIDKFMQLKANGQLGNFMHIKNYNKTVKKMPVQESVLINSIYRYDGHERQFESSFYLYYNFIKKYTPEQIQALQLNSKDKKEYFDNRTGKDATGYIWEEKSIFIPASYEMVAILNMDIKQMLDIREKLNIPLNIIITAMLDLGLLGKDIERKDWEKILSNYYKFNLNVRIGKYTDRIKNGEQVIRLLLSLPDDLDGVNYENIRECAIGRFSRFELDEFEQVQNCERICDEKILEEFERNEEVNELRKFIFETKIKDLNGIKRDIYFYKKYLGEKVTENETLNLFEILFENQDKQQMMEAYKKLNSISESFYLDDALSEIRKTLAEISKEDVVTKMAQMKEKIRNGPTRNIDGQEVIDLTGTDFNLLISVIGGSGSPYLVSYENNLTDELNKRFIDRPELYGIARASNDIQKKLGVKRLINTRYKLDPFKNKQRCVSSIDQDFIGHIRSFRHQDENKQIKQKLILAYFPQNEADVFCMGNRDLMTYYDKDRSDLTRKRIPHRDNMSRVCNLKLQDLNNTTIGNDNELVIDSYPGAVMCFDGVPTIARKTAQRLNAPILYIDSKRQFEIIKGKIEEYFENMQKKISGDFQMTDKTFAEAYNMFEGNIIHEAFKLAHGFGFLDDDEYPKEQVLDIFDKMKNLVKESLRRCNDTQRETIQAIMQKEANIYNIKYGRYYKFIDFQGLNSLVKPQEESEVTK